MDIKLMILSCGILLWWWGWWWSVKERVDIG